MSDRDKKKYSGFAIVKEGLRDHKGWGKAWKKAEPKSQYDVVIIGAGGHGYF